MNDQTDDLDRDEEHVLSCIVSDEALEAAARSTQEKFAVNTWSSMGFPTNCILSCCNT
jgi:hypothetical protein